jgi:diguanylate cyclase (GGDEF)-like protein
MLVLAQVKYREPVVDEPRAARDFTPKPREQMNRPTRGVENRRYGRLKGPGLACSAGTVIDLSAGGVRILSNRRLKGRTVIYFGIRQEQRLGVKSKIVWCRRVGFRTFLVGLQFEDLPLEAAKRLLRHGACAGPPRKPKHTPRPARVGALTLGLLLCAAGVLFRVGGGQGWFDNIGLPAEIGAFSLLSTGPLFVLGVIVLTYALLRQLARPTAAQRGGEVAQIQQASADRRDPRMILDSILESALGGVLILQSVRDDMDNITDFVVQTANPASEQLLGRSTEDIVGRRLNTVLPCLAPEGLFEKAVSVVETGLPHEGSQRLMHDQRWYRYTAVKLGDGLAVTFADISEQRETEDKLRHAAYHDTLTGLPNRKLLTEHLVKAINRADRVKGYKFAVLFLDFDRFKIINDSLGHEAGDQLLLQISKRLRENLRELDTTARLGDGHLPSRLGGDEFVVLLEGIREDHSAATVAQRLLDSFSEPYSILGHEVTSTASIGIVVSDARYAKPDDILRDADTAMYQAKSEGKARYVIFDEMMHKLIVNRLTTENELRAAVEAEAFEVVYEPIVCLSTGQLKGLEALIRWPHPRRGQVAPGEFINIAEELGLMGAIGRWVLRRACLDFVDLCRKNPDSAPEFINVNVSRSQLRDPGLVGHVNAIMLETGIGPGMLRLEITESMVMDDLEKMVGVLTHLKELGLGLAMDDFGTGHSSLTCLHQFPLDILKIDRSFINSVGRKERYYGAILHSVIELSRNLDMAVVAEGIENANQLALLQGLGCQYGQGYLFSEPVSIDNATPLLDRNFNQSIAA